MAKSRCPSASHETPVVIDDGEARDQKQEQQDQTPSHGIGPVLQCGWLLPPCRHYIAVNAPGGMAEN